MNRSLILSACCLSGAVMTGCTHEQTQKPNIIFIYADDIGYGDLECYGATAVRTPNVNRLANSGIRFVNAYSALQRAPHRGTVC